MVAPGIFNLYTAVWEPMLSNELTGNDIIEFSKKLPKLRDALSCCVCKQLLTNKEALLPSECRQHFVCRGCLRKEREDDKKCKRCEDWSTYGEDQSLTDMIKSYQEFCFFFLTSERIVRVLEVKHEVDPKFDTFELIDLVKEGLKGYQKIKKRKLSCNVARDKGVVPLDVVRRNKKACESTSAFKENKSLPEAKNVQSAAAANDNVGEKVETKKAVNEGTQDKTLKVKSKQSSSDTTTSKSPAPTPTTTQSSTPTTKSVPVVTTSSVPLKTQTTSAVSTTVSTLSKTVYPAKAAVKSPPLVTIKVEVQTSPEKQQSPIRQNDGNESPCSSITDPLQDPLGDLPKPPPPKPILVVSRPPITSNASCVTTSVCNTSTLPYRITSTPIVSSQSHMGPQIIQIAHPTGIKTVSIRPQQIRLTGTPGRIPVQLLATASGTTPSNTTTESLRTPLITRPQTTGQTGSPTTSTSPALKRRIIFTTATPHDLIRWPNTDKVLQFATGDLSRFPALAGIRPSLISVGQSCPITGIRTSVSTTNVRPVVANTSLPLVRPPSTSGVITTSGQTFFTTNSSLGAQVHSSGISFVRSAGPTTTATSVGSVPRPPQGLFTPTTTTTVTRQVPVVSSPSTTSPVFPVKRKPEGCRCGNAATLPGKLTCIGQRCACYADRNACSDCKCKGCKNPYVPGSAGKKVLHGVRAYLDPQTSQGIPFIATPIGQGTSCSAMVTGSPNSTVTQTNPPLVTAVGSFGTIQTGIPQSVSSNTMSQAVPPFQFIPVRFGPNGTPQYLQITNPQALQQMPIILSTSGHLQTNSSGITIQGIPMSGLSASGLHQISQLQQQRLAQMNIKPERNPPQE